MFDNIVIKHKFNNFSAYNTQNNKKTNNNSTW